MDDVMMFEQIEDSFAQLEQEELSFNTLTQELSQLMAATTALETFGAQQGTLAMLSIGGLLTTTATAGIATESLKSKTPEKTITELATESLMDSIKEKSARWAAKIAHLTKDAAGKVLNIISPLFTKASDLVKKLASKSWDKVKAGGRHIKAHPVGTVLSVVTAMAAVAAIMAYCGSSLPGGSATKETIASFLEKVNGQITKIPGLGGKVESVVTDSGNFRIDRVFMPKAVVASEESLGWTATGVKVLGTKLDALIQSIKHGMGALGMRAMNIASDVGHGTFDKINAFRRAAPQTVYNMTGSREAAHATSFALGGIVYGTCISVVYAVYRLVKSIVVGGFRLIISTLTNLF